MLVRRTFFAEVMREGVTIDDDRFAGADGEELAWEDFLKEENGLISKDEGKENEVFSPHVESDSDTSVSAS